MDDEIVAAAEAALAACRARGWRVATAESCTGGLVAGALTEPAGSSDVMLGGIVAYADAAKTALLRVDASLFPTQGAVSQPVADLMARGAARALRADVAVSVTGIAGPGGGTAEKPVGLVWFGLFAPSGVSTERQIFPGDRAAVRRATVLHALEMVRSAS